MENVLINPLCITVPSSMACIRAPNADAFWNYLSTASHPVKLCAPKIMIGTDVYKGPVTLLIDDIRSRRIDVLGDRVEDL